MSDKGLEVKLQHRRNVRTLALYSMLEFGMRYMFHGDRN